MSRLRLLPMFVFLLAVACGEKPSAESSAGSSAGAKAPAAARLRIAMVPKGTTHVFWKAVESGARQAADELGVDLVWKGPLSENDRAGQIQLVQQLLAEKVDGLALAPLDHQALVAPVAAATAQGIPVVIFDSALDGTAGKDFAAFVATDNQAAGRMGGEHLAKLLEGDAGVVLLRYQVGSASTEARETGFLEAMADAGVKVLVNNRYAGPTVGEATTTALNMAEPLRAAGGIFCSNESATNGMLLALRQMGLAGTKRFVGFDASPALVEALQQGEIDALVVQDPRRMGYKALEAVVRRVRGELVDPITDTGAVVVTRDQLEDPAIRRLVE
ncbi:MAG: substrate-binding domain-containing protein [Phycisphaerales bacterium]|nr:substrate-binding domain-containing protein [Phycisphaerales bacterium]